MPSEYQKKKAAKKKEAAKQKGGKKPKETPVDSGESTPNTNGTATPLNGASSNSEPKTYEEELCARLEKEATLAAEARACTGTLAIHPMSRDIKIANFSVTFHGVELLQDTKLGKI